MNALSRKVIFLASAFQSIGAFMDVSFAPARANHSANAQTKRARELSLAGAHEKDGS
jgi:hypothetical protein